MGKTEALSLRINSEEDRVRIAGILVKNGYMVKQGKVPRTGTKSMDYVLLIEDARGEKIERN
jgi:hypothetical protein